MGRTVLRPSLSWVIRGKRIVGARNAKRFLPELLYRKMTAIASATEHKLNGQQESICAGNKTLGEFLLFERKTVDKCLQICYARLDKHFY